MTKFAAITYELTGYSLLSELRFATDLTTGACGLTLVLLKSEMGADAITAVFDHVSDLVLREFGGGITQLLYLAIEDVSIEQRDRARYRVRELERDMLSFYCSSVTIQSRV